MNYDFIDARDRLAGIEHKLCVFVSIPVPPGSFEDTQRVFTGVLYDLARFYRAKVDEIRRVIAGIDAVDAEANRVLFFRAHRRAGWYGGKDGAGRPGFFKFVFQDKRKERDTREGDVDLVASGVVDEDDMIRWKRVTDGGEERYLVVRVMKCLDVQIGSRPRFSGLLIVEDHHPRLVEKLQRVSQSIRQVRPEVTVDLQIPPR